MNCPRCQSGDIDLFGLCPVCGYEVSELDNEPARKPEDMPPEEETEQNLQNIIDAAVSRQAVSSSFPESGEPAPISAAEEFIFSEPEKDDAAADLFFVINDDAPDVSDAAYVIDAGDVTDSGECITYTAVAGEAAAVEDAADIADSGKDIAEIAVHVETVVPDNYKVAEDAAAAAVPESIADANDFASAANAPGTEGRLIFLSRTLSGLVDLFLTALFSGIFLGLADYFTNAPMLNSMSAINFTALFLMIYFLYSIFFLGTNSQTIGMMVADLHVVGADENHLSMPKVVRRSAAFLVSLLTLGIGLLAGVFSRKCLCLHDRLSGTRIVRTLEH